MGRRWFWTGALALCAALGVVATAYAETSPKPMTFTQAQAAHGQTLFDTNCAACHSSNLGGGPAGPPLTGATFRMRFQAQAGDALYTFVRDKMPPNAPLGLPPADYADIVAYILAGNGGKAGKTPLPADAQALAPLSLAASLPPMAAPVFDLPVSPQGLPPDVHETDAVKQREARLAKLTPVTDAMLRNPPDGDWIHTRRSYDSHGFSPLSQIDRGNVAKLTPAWVWELPPNKNEITPLVHDGIMFVASNGQVQALDAVTGDLLWKYIRPGTFIQLRSLAISGDMIYFAAESHMVALNAHTGKVVWETQLIPDGYAMHVTSGPLVVKGLLMQGAGYCMGPYPGGCYLVALDAATGKEKWRFNTVARPGQPGGESWNNRPLDKRWGGGVWITGSYDPELDLLYFGVGQTYSVASLLKDYDGTAGGNDGLFTDSTIAVRPETGELVWHYQHMNRDVWDLDWAFERTIATIMVDGKPRRTVTTGGKLSIFDTLDAATGQYLFSYDTGLQTLVQSIDPKTGAKIVKPELIPTPGKLTTFCTSSLGGRDWPATAFNAKTGILYVPSNDICTEFTWAPGPDFDMRIKFLRRIGGDGLLGRVEAIDLASHKSLWVQRRRAPQIGSILGTAGDLIFEGGRDRWFRASDERTGKVLWQFRLNAAPSSSPIAYSVDGVEYIAVIAGGGASLDGYIGGVMAPEIPAPASGTTLWVFRLPEKK